jgi:hypothetical protein
MESWSRSRRSASRSFREPRIGVGELDVFEAGQSKVEVTSVGLCSYISLQKSKIFLR